MTICCVTVTYGNRFHLLSRVVKELLDAAVNVIVIVDNGSAEESRRQLDNLQNQHPGIIQVIRFDKNEGSAKGFKTGIRAAVESGTDFIWLLDDDNKPAHNALQELTGFWATVETPRKEALTALSAYRNDRPNYTEALLENDPAKILQPRNNFAGFHIKTLYLKLAARIFSRRQQAAILPRAGRIKAAAYGGLFFHRKLVDTIGLPDESYFLYADDFAFTYPLSEKGGDIWLVTSSRIEDLESSFYIAPKKKMLSHSLFDAPREANIYYAFRNSIYFSKTYLTTNKTVYTLNKYIFLALITLMALLRGKIRRLGLLRDAVADGESGKLGKNSKYTI